MFQSLSLLYAGLTFSTKKRIAFLQNKELRIQMHAYLGGISKKLGCQPIIVNGFYDHVHILAKLNRNITQSNWVKELKRISTFWYKNKRPEHYDFAWQRGYAIFSVSKSNVDVVTEYISQQEQHHKKISFQDELRLLLNKHNMDWDEKYLWD